MQLDLWSIAMSGFQQLQSSSLQSVPLKYNVSDVPLTAFSSNISGPSECSLSDRISSVPQPCNVIDT